MRSSEISSYNHDSVIAMMSAGLLNKSVQVRDRSLFIPGVGTEEIWVG